MVLLDKVWWDDVAGGPNPDKGLGKLRKQLATKPLIIKDDGGESSNNNKYQRSASMPAAATRIASPPVLSPALAWKPDVWRSVFDSGSNLNSTKTTLGANLFDTPQPNSPPTVYDWLYGKETRSKHH